MSSPGNGPRKDLESIGFNMLVLRFFGGQRDYVKKRGATGDFDYCTQVE